MIGRRGFLGTMLAAAVGAVANFDPSKGLWVPGHAAAPETLKLVETAVAPTWSKDVLAEAGELADLAIRFAKRMAGRLEKHASVALHHVAMEMVGRPNLGTLRILQDDGQSASGAFAAPGHRLVKQAWEGVHGSAQSVNDYLDWAAAELRRDVDPYDLFVPIGSELRTGVPFTGDIMVGVGTDPDSGLSARALRFRTIDNVVHTSFEVASGTWHGAGARARRREASGRRSVPKIVAPDAMLSSALLIGEAHDAADADVQTSEGSFRG